MFTVGDLALPLGVPNKQQPALFPFGSSEEFVGKWPFRQLAKCVMEREFVDAEGPKAVGFSRGDFGFVVQALHHAAGELFLGLEVVEQKFAASSAESMGELRLR